MNRWGCRTVTIIGAFLATFCMIVSYWAQSVTTLYFTIGIGTGFGFGLIYLPAIVCVTIYFEKKRSLATGIAVCGSGLGTFIFAPIINYLVQEYNWRGSMLIISAGVLECVIFGALFRPLEPQKKRKRIDSIINEDAKLESLPLSVPEVTGRPRSMGHFTIPRNIKFEENGNVPGEMKNSEINRLTLSQPLLTSSTHEHRHRIHRHGSQHERGMIYKPDIFYQRSLQNISAVSSEVLQRRMSSLVKLKRSQIEEEETKMCGCIPCSKETKDTLREMLNFSLFCDILFVLFTISNFLTSLGFNIPYVFMISQAKSLGMDSDQSSLLLSVIGIANTVGRIVLGYLADKPWVNRLYIYNVCLMLCGGCKYQLNAY